MVVAGALDKTFWRFVLRPRDTEQGFHHGTMTKMGHENP